MVRGKVRTSWFVDEETIRRVRGEASMTLGGAPLAPERCAVVDVERYCDARLGGDPNGSIYRGGG